MADNVLVEETLSPIINFYDSLNESVGFYYNFFKILSKDTAENGKKLIEDNMEILDEINVVLFIEFNSIIHFWYFNFIKDCYFIKNSFFKNKYANS